MRPVSVGVAVFLAACASGGSSPDAGTPDVFIIDLPDSDLTDVASPPDVASLPDVAAPPDVASLPDVASPADVAVPLDDAAIVDATPPADGPDATPSTCLVEADFGAATLTMQSAIGIGVATDPDVMQLVAQLNSDPLPDLFVLELYNGYGVFPTAITTGTFDVLGVEQDYATCGVCPRVFTDYDIVTGMTGSEQYFAKDQPGISSGSVTITTFNPNLSGSVSNVILEEVTINPTTFESTPVPGGCETMIMSGSFDVAVTWM